MNSTPDPLLLTIQCVSEILRQNKNKEMVLKPDTNILHETSLDSIDLLEVIVLLEKKTGKTPFRKGMIPFQTIQELANLYK